jgi:hypothetical protein
VKKRELQQAKARQATKTDAVPAQAKVLEPNQAALRHEKRGTKRPRATDEAGTPGEREEVDPAKSRRRDKKKMKMIMTEDREGLEPRANMPVGCHN